MSAPDIASIIEICDKRLGGTRRLNNLLHNADFVQKKMSQVNYVFSESSKPPPLALVLNQIATLLRADTAIREIIAKECGPLQEQAYYPHFLFYCSIIVYVEYVRSGYVSEKK